MSAAAPCRAYVGLGANLGEPLATVVDALARLQPLGLVAASSLYRSAPIDAHGPPYVNAVAMLHTALDAPALLRALQAIETEFGRVRPYLNAPRTLDLDLLLHGSTVCHSATLTLPHPRLHRRAFVLMPLLELDPTLQLPGLGALSAYLAATAGQAIERLQAPPTMPS